LDALEAVGAGVLSAHRLDDQQRLTDALLARLDRDAAMRNAQIVTTEKDAVRLPAAFRSKVVTVPVRLVFDDPSALDAFLSPIATAQNPSRDRRPRVP